MNQEYKTKWLEALRSGEYKQGMAYLCRDNKFCCLGVLYDIATKNEPEKYQWNGNVPNIDPMGGVCLPPTFAEEINIGLGGYIKELDRSLWYMNDHGDTFMEIADIIEKYL